MYARKLKLLQHSGLLLGPRQTGKTTFIKAQLTQYKVFMVDLLIPDVFYRYSSHPQYLLDDIQSQMDPLVWASREGNHTKAQGAEYDRLFGERAAIQDQIKKYREANSTNNYVLFRDDIVNILKKWGLIGPTVGAGVSKFMSPSDEMKQ